jgi:Uma2 family endonuclease
MAARTPRFETIDELLDSLGGISPDRVRFDPLPGTATERDVLRLYEDHKRLFELVDGTLVEKVMGSKESFIAMYLGHLLLTYSERNGDLGMVLGEAGTLRLLKKLVRIPDVSFTLWERLPNRKVPSEPIPDLAPDLAVEVLSRKNTKREMERKLKEYFLAGVRLVWFIDPRARTVRAFTSPDESAELAPGDDLDGGEVLPGFRVPVARLFADLADEPLPPAGKPGKGPKR